MNAETPSFAANPPERQPSTALMIKDGFVVPTAVYLEKMQVPQPNIPPIKDDSGAIAAATTFFEIQKRQIARATDKNGGEIYPFISGTAEGEAILAKTLHSKIAEYGKNTNKWPTLYRGSTVTLNSPQFEVASPSSPQERVVVTFPQRRAITAASAGR